VVISVEEEAQIRVLMDELRRDTHSAAGGYASSLTPYLDRDAYRKLSAFGWKSVPFMVEEAALWYSIYDVGLSPRVKIDEVRSTALSPSLISTALRAWTSDDQGPEARSGLGIGSTDCFVWLDWWQRNGARFDLESGVELWIPTVTEPSFEPHIATSVQDGLLDLHAVEATGRHIIQRAAAELGVDVFIGQEHGLSDIRTVRMSGVDFEGFLSRLIESPNGSSWEKTDAGYRVGEPQSSTPRLYVYGWGLAMERSVWQEGEPMTALVVVSDLGRRSRAVRSELLAHGRFQLLDNDGEEVHQCPALRSAGRVRCAPDIGGQCRPTTRDQHALRFTIHESCVPAAGEYSLRFIWQEHRTPTIPVEVYGNRDPELLDSGTQSRTSPS